MVHQSMASHLQGWGHLLHWGHSHTPMFIRVNLYAVLQCTVCLYKCLLCPVDLAELCPNQHDSSAEAQGVKCRSVVQVSQVAKHSSCERFIFSTSTVRSRATEYQTCKANVLPLVRKLCNARTRSLRVIAPEVVMFAGEDCAKLSVDRPPERMATVDIQLQDCAKPYSLKTLAVSSQRRSRTAKLSWRDDTNID